jgi:hypothetical protein
VVAVGKSLELLTLRDCAVNLVAQQSFDPFLNIYTKMVLYFVIADGLSRCRRACLSEHIYEKDQAFTIRRVAKRELQ